MSSSQKIMFRSSDRSIFFVEEEVLVQSETIKHLIEEEHIHMDIEIPVLDVDHNTLTKVVNYLRMHLNNKDSEVVLDTWDAEFVNVDHNMLCRLMTAAKTLKIGSLMHLLFYKMTDMIKGSPCDVAKCSNPSSPIKEIVWSFPPPGWIKLNSDGSSKRNRRVAGAGGLFRDCYGNFQGCFAYPIDFVDSLYAELFAIITAIEIAYDKRWIRLWIESDCTMAISIVRGECSIPCELENRWNHCKKIMEKMDIRITHTYREGNKCADLLANLATKIDSPTWWNCMPNLIYDDWLRDKHQLPNFRVL